MSLSLSEPPEAGCLARAEATVQVFNLSVAAPSLPTSLSDGEVSPPQSVWHFSCQLVGSHVNCVCTDLTSVREPVETEPNLSQPSFFLRLRLLHKSRHVVISQCFLKLPMSQERTRFNQIFDVFFPGVLTPSITQGQMPRTCWIHLQ